MADNAFNTLFPPEMRTFAEQSVAQARKAINASGLEQSSLDNFNFSNVDINAAAAGDINYAQNWTLKNVSIKAKDNSTLSVQNSKDISL